MDEPLPLFDSLPGTGGSAEDRAGAGLLPAVMPAGEVDEDYQRSRLSLRGHPVSFIRDGLDRDGVTPCRCLQDETSTPAGKEASVAGLVLVRQRPGTASGIVFMTIEDETGIANLVLVPQVFERFRAVARHAAAVVCTGVVERQGSVVHLKALGLNDPGFEGRSRDFH